MHSHQVLKGHNPVRPKTSKRGGATLRWTAIDPANGSNRVVQIHSQKGRADPQSKEQDCRVNVLFNLDQGIGRGAMAGHEVKVKRHDGRIDGCRNHDLQPKPLKFARSNGSRGLGGYQPSGKGPAHGIHHVKDTQATNGAENRIDTILRRCVATTSRITMTALREPNEPVNNIILPEYWLQQGARPRLYTLANHWEPPRLVAIDGNKQPRIGTVHSSSSSPPGVGF